MAKFVRVAETTRETVTLQVNGHEVRALENDTILVALMMSTGNTGQSDFGDGPRAGFCMMGACQDCLVWTSSGMKLRSCTTPVENGMNIHTTPPEGTWPTIT